MNTSTTSPLVLGIDVGTGSAKAVLADAYGHFFATASYGYHYSSPAPGLAEQDPYDWWRAVCFVSHQLMGENPGAADRVSGIAVSGQGVACVLLDEHGDVLRNALLWMDTRATAQAERLSREHGDELTRISGKKAAPYNVEPKLLWLRENEPALWQKTAKATTTTGFINYCLTGRSVMNRSDAGLLLGYDLRRQNWSSELLDLMKLPKNLFFELAHCDEIIGSLNNSAAREMGLPAGILVVAGGEDTSSAALALGVIAENDVLLSMGKASTIFMPFHSPLFDSRLLGFPHVLRDLTLMGGSMISGGNSTEWLMKLIHPTDASTAEWSNEFQELEKQAIKLPCGSNGLIFLPYLAGELQPVNDGFARGVFFGLQLDMGSAHLLRAVIEGTAFAIRHNLEVLRDCGAEPVVIKAVGGPTRSDFWCQVISNVIGLPIEVSSGQTGAAFGDALLAAIGVGMIDDPHTMQRAHHSIRKSFQPQDNTRFVYQELYAIYRALYPRLFDLFPRLNSLATRPTEKRATLDERTSKTAPSQLKEEKVAGGHS